MAKDKEKKLHPKGPSFYKKPAGPGLDMGTEDTAMDEMEPAKKEMRPGNRPIPERGKPMKKKGNSSGNLRGEPY
jgi:hypothetical protein